MKILISDGLRPKGLQLLKDAGIDFDIKFYEHDELVKVIPEYDCIIVRSATKVPKDVIDAGKNLKAICRAGTGIDNIDHVYARSIGIPVLNAPGENSASVSELVFAHLFAMTRFIPQANITMRNGEWNKKQYKGVELFGKTIGVIGFGRIGQITARMALNFGMKVLAYDITNPKADLNVEFTTDLEKVLKNSDFITLHTPKLEKPVIGKQEFALMQDGVYLVNCARGGVVDEEALLEALDSGKLAGAGIDTFVNEPKPNLKLVNHPKVCATPHVGANTNDALDRVGIVIAKKAIDALKG